MDLLDAVPDGSTELMCHPGRCGEALRHARTRLKESREHELEALVAPEVRQALERNGIELVNYGGLVSATTSAEDRFAMLATGSTLTAM